MNYYTKPPSKKNSQAQTEFRLWLSDVERWQNQSLGLAGHQFENARTLVLSWAGGGGGGVRKTTSNDDDDDDTSLGYEDEKGLLPCCAQGGELD